MNEAKLIVQFLFLSLLFVSTLSRADEAIALLESIRASSDYREFKSRNEIPAPILARAEKFAGAIYNPSDPLSAQNRFINSIVWAVIDRNYYLMYLSQGGGVAPRSKFLMYYAPTKSKEIIKVVEYSFGSYSIKNYSEFLDAIKINPLGGLLQPITDDINKFLLDHR